MCKMCDTTNDRYPIYQTYPNYVYIERKLKGIHIQDTLQVERFDRFTEIEINFCPICGRNLKGESE